MVQRWGTEANIVTWTEECLTYRYTGDQQDGWMDGLWPEQHISGKQRWVGIRMISRECPFSCRWRILRRLLDKTWRELLETARRHHFEDGRRETVMHTGTTIQVRITDKSPCLSSWYQWQYWYWPIYLYIEIYTNNDQYNII